MFLPFPVQSPNHDNALSSRGTAGLFLEVPRETLRERSRAALLGRHSQPSHGTRSTWATSPPWSGSPGKRPALLMRQRRSPVWGLVPTSCSSNPRSRTLSAFERSTRNSPESPSTERRGVSRKTLQPFRLTDDQFTPWMFHVKRGLRGVVTHDTCADRRMVCFT